MAAERSEAPIFVVGTGRSGTTLLRLMLSSHRRIHLTHELSFYVWDALFDRRQSGEAMLDFFLRSFSFRWLGLPPETLRAALPDTFARSQGHTIFSTVMRLAAQREGKVRFGDKTPSHAGHLERIFRDFPDARVVHIVRDPRGTLLSLSRMPWASASDLANAFLYENDWRATSRFASRIHRVRLEDLLATPEPVLRGLLAFVGEAWDPAVLDHARHPPVAERLPPLPWLASSKRPLGAPAARWEALSPLRIRRIEGLCRRSMLAYGYAPAPLERAPGLAPVLGSILLQVPGALRFAWLYLRLGLMHRDPGAFDDRRRDALFARLNPQAWAQYPGFTMPAPPALPGAAVAPEGR